jgi:hypothetical protein
MVAMPPRGVDARTYRSITPEEDYPERVLDKRLP